MKTLVVISRSRTVGEAIVAQLRKFFPDSVPVARYCLHEAFDFCAAESLAVISGPQARSSPKVQEKIAQGLDHVVARRVIDCTRIQDLLMLPEGEEVLLVNDFASTAQDAIDHLVRIGLDHLVYHPYSPGMMDFPRLKVAVTPGEAALAPSGVERIIDIGTRPVDISTIMELVQRLGLMDELGDAISAQHLREITRLLREINAAGKRVSRMRDTLEAVADHAPNGILYTDLAGRVMLGNRTMVGVLRMDRDAMVGKPVTALVPGFPEAGESAESGTIVSVGGQDLIVRSRAVSQDGTLVGHIHAFETGQTIQNLEYELRRKARMSEHVARYTFEDILSRSPRMEWVLAFARRVSQSDATILIQGESGTGKELIAQAIHNASQRGTGPFVPVNFAAFPASLLESELFGYEEGAFTGARRGGRRGLFAEAHGGTVFLDEIGDAPVEFQVRLLRILQERQVRPVGGRKQIPIDVRVIAATNKNLLSEVKGGRFREDLYYRLSVLPLRVPSLRERKEDVPLLLDQFCSRFSRGKHDRISAIVAPDTFAHLCDHAWPGNIRQLMNTVEYLLNVHEDPHPVPASQLPEHLQGEEPRQEDELVQELLGRDLVWVLRRLREAGGIGRRHLAQLAGPERPHLTEAVIRGILLTAESLGFTKPGKGRRGTVLTEKGRMVIERWGPGPPT